MYQNFDEKYISIVYDEGSSATLTQTTLAYWDSDYGKKVLSNDEQLNMYLKPVVSPAIKYLMYDNMVKLVDANAFIKAERIEDALSNIKYNFYTKRNVRYTIVFPAQFKNINLNYLNSFELLYQKLDEMLKLNDASEVSISSDAPENATISNGVTADVVSVTTPEHIETLEIETIHVEPNEESLMSTNFEESIKLEEKQAHIREENENSKDKYDFEPKKIKKNEEISRVIFNEEDADDFKDEPTKEVNKEELVGILESLDLE